MQIASVVFQGPAAPAGERLAARGRTPRAWN